MAENELVVQSADGLPRTTRSVDLGGSIHIQGALIAELPEVPVDPTGGLTRYTVTSASAVALDSPTAAARYARLRVYETTAPTTPTKRLYYRTDGTNPTNAGANAFGYLLHGEMLLVRLADATNFRMIADSGDAGSFQVYVEWLNIPTS